jgi:hypothetical protein
MTECERYGMSHGCDENCPVLNEDECPFVIEEIESVFKNLIEQSRYNK